MIPNSTKTDYKRRRHSPHPPQTLPSSPPLPQKNRKEANSDRTAEKRRQTLFLLSFTLTTVGCYSVVEIDPSPNEKGGKDEMSLLGRTSEIVSMVATLATKRVSSPLGMRVQEKVKISIFLQGSVLIFFWQYYVFQKCLCKNMIAHPRLMVSLFEKTNQHSFFNVPLVVPVSLPKRESSSYVLVGHYQHSFRMFHLNLDMLSTVNI